MADVAADLGVVAQPCQKMGGDRGRGALPLRAGYARDAVERHILQPEPEPTADRYPGPFDLSNLGTVSTDARTLDHHVARQQRLEPTIFGGQNL